MSVYKNTELLEFLRTRSSQFENEYDVLTNIVQL